MAPGHLQNQAKWSVEEDIQAAIPCAADTLANEESVLVEKPRRRAAPGRGLGRGDEDSDSAAVEAWLGGQRQPDPQRPDP
jgi:hypothetical protein